MTDLRQAALEQQADPKYIVQSNGRHSPLLTHMMTKRTTPAQAEPPPEWPLIKNILAEYGLDAISFVAEWKVAQRPWVVLTDEEIHRTTVLLGFNPEWKTEIGMAHAIVRNLEAKLKERNT